MINYNYHTHSTFCDGKNELEEMIQAAIDCGIKILGISSHGPLPFEAYWVMNKERMEEYISKVKELTDKYKDKIEILLGMELDYLPELGLDYVDKKLLNRLDYYIGSVHFLGELNDGYKWTVDESLEVIEKGIKENFGGNFITAAEKYYECIADLAEKYNAPIIGHFDLIKKNNSDNVLFDEKIDEYRMIVEKCLSRISKTNSVIEINTGGKARGYTKEYYPSTWILEIIKDKQIPITINSDAHFITGINHEFEQAYQLIKDLGFESYMYLTKDGWKKASIC